MKAIFKGKSGNCLWNRHFTIGKAYDLTDNGSGNYITRDDNGVMLFFRNGHGCTFELIDESNFVKNEWFEIKCSSPSLKLFINGFSVSPEEFEDVKYVVERLDDDGVKCDTIKFEVKFE